jgi:hypothetical protein
VISWGTLITEEPPDSEYCRMATILSKSWKHAVSMSPLLLEEEIYLCLIRRIMHRIAMLKYAKKQLQAIIT